ncbi:MAG TPA: nucleotidyl transferase AbiEii/AbiGii toxin family protein [Thermoanaerobaculia bacterium]|jgi:hypothetical protein|nr:nucleotidyl transferase AbiEii/AbiGii toxin family protein [Thermoanaerobaculia bacterium]
MFQAEQNQKILMLLTALDAELLSRCSFVFGGGARIVLELDEFRDSRGITLVCSDAEGFSDLRYAVASLGYDALFKAEARKGLHLSHEIRFNPFGIRFPVGIGGTEIPVELRREARIELDPGVRPPWSPVDCLSIADCFAEKLLANSDRRTDRQELSRDLIDLSALRGRIGPIPEEAWYKVDDAYRAAGRDALLKALLAFLEDEPHQQRCFKGLNIEAPAEILAGVSQLLMDLEAPSQAS